MAVQPSCAATACRNAANKAWNYAKANYWELPASILEAATLVLVVFFQDIGFKEIIVTSGVMMTVSFCLHGLGYRAGQCQKWPKAIEIVAPFLFYGLIPAAYLATQITYKTVFIIINYWFVFWQIIFWVGLKRNFMQEYLEDWNPQRVWDTPLIQQCAKTVAISWMICEAIMGAVQIFVVVFNISLATNAAAAIMLCYVMQLLPLLWAVVFTFAYPASVKRKWGYQHGVRETCYPPPPHTQSATSTVEGLLPTVESRIAEGSSSNSDLNSYSEVGLVVDIDSEVGNGGGSSSSRNSSRGGTKKDCDTE